MKWTLLVATCLVAFTFSPPASARPSHKESHAKPHVQAQIGPAAIRAQGRHASASKHTASSRSGMNRHPVAAIRPGHHARNPAGHGHVASLGRQHAASSTRHGRFVAARNRTVREVRVDSEGGLVGVASYYSANGLTAAHRTLPFGTRVRVTNLSNGSTVIVRIADRGPFIRGRSIDLSAGAARAIGMTGAGIARVRMHVI